MPWGPAWTVISSPATMKLRHSLLAALGVGLLGGAVTMACTSPARVFGPNTSGTGGGNTGDTTSSGAGSGTMSSGTGTTTTIPCMAPSDCPGKESECQTRSCDKGFCGIGFSAAGKPITAQYVGDCQRIVCDGQGTITQQIDDSDLPHDSNPCTQDICSTGMPSHPATPSGTMCGGALVCDNQGKCTGCVGPADCPGADTDCQKRSCIMTVCGFIYQPAGTKATMQNPADCKQNICNGMGAVSVIFDSTDPLNDGNDCTVDGCSNGSPTHINVLAGGPCSGADKSKTVCDGGGDCVECVSALSCKGQDTECATRKCTAGACGYDFTAFGTPVALQKSGDCHKSVCDGNGGVTQVVDDSDIQQDGNLCTGDTCSGGVIGHPPIPAGTDCGAPKTCDGSGNCNGCSFAAQCAGQDTECQSRTCTTGVCGFNFMPNGTPAQAQTPGDCQKNVCDGSGGTTVIADDTDAASDGVECTLDQCSGGSPLHLPKPVGAVCTVGGSICNGIGGCGVCTPFTTIDCGCGTKSGLCCGNPIPIKSGQKVLAPQSNDPGAIPDQICCCYDQVKDCDMNGHWGSCY